VGRAAVAGLAAFDINPIHWLGGAAADAAADGWKAAMIGLWSAGLWLLRLVFGVVDAFATPDLSDRGPMGPVWPTTLWLAGWAVGLLMLVQLSVALVRRDGKSLGTVVLGTIQFGLAWVGYLGVAGGAVLAAAALERGILHAMLGVDTLSAYDITTSWPRKVTDATVATVLGILSLLLLIPAAFAYLLIMLVRSAALVMLAATSPITASGLVADSTRSWFWKSLRWFVSALLIAPTAALALGIGVKLSAGVVSGAGDKTAAAAGMAVVGTVLVAVGAVCPLVLFRLLAFVDPGTASGAALRQSWSDAGGLAGLTRTAQPSGSGAASQSGSDGRSSGESGAESQTRARFAGAFGAVGGAVGAAASMAHRAVDLGSDVLGQAGVGAPGYSMTPTDERSSRRGASSSTDTAPGRDAGSPGQGSGPAPSPQAPPPQGPEPQPPATPPTPPAGPPSGGAGAGGAGADGAGAGAAVEAAAVAAL